LRVVFLRGVEKTRGWKTMSDSFTRPVDDAIAQLLRGDRHAREQAAVVLSGSSFDVTRLAPLLAHPHVSRQVKAIEIMRDVRSPAAISLLVPMLGSPEPLVARKVAGALHRIGPAAADAIAASLPGSTELHRLWILDALSRLRDLRGRDPLIEIAAHATHPGWRASALGRLRHYHDALTVDTIGGALRDSDPGVRKTACEVAGIVRDASLLAPLIAIWLDETSPPLEAMFALRKYSAAAMDPLIAVAADAEPERRKRISDALRWCMASPQGRTQLWTLWKRPEPAVRDACLQFLGDGYARSLPAPPRAAALAEHIADPDPQRRRWCVEGYRQLAADRDPTVRMNAELMMRRLDPQ